MPSVRKYRFMPTALIALLLILPFAFSAFSAEPLKSTGDTPEARRATKALNLLEAHGFGRSIEERQRNSFQDFHQLNNNFVATVQQNGRTFRVFVDPDAGQIISQD
jgi:hypothetical protein